MKTFFRLFPLCLICLVQLPLNSFSPQAIAQSENQAAMVFAKNDTDVVRTEVPETINVSKDKSTAILSLMAPLNVEIEEFLPDSISNEFVPYDPVLPQTLIEVENDSWEPIFSPDGQKIMTRRGLTIEIRDAETLKILRTFERGLERAGHSAAFFSPDGKKIVARATVVPPPRQDRKDKHGRFYSNFLDEKDIIQIWDIESGRELKKFEGKFDHSCRFSPAGEKFLALRQNLWAKMIWNSYFPF